MKCALSLNLSGIGLNQSVELYNGFHLDAIHETTRVPSTPRPYFGEGMGSQEKHHVPWMCKWRGEVLTLIGLNRKALYKLVF